MGQREGSPPRRRSLDPSAASPLRSTPNPDRPPILVVTACEAQGSGGGWGYVICFPSGQESESGGAATETTAHGMALTAVIRALERLEPADGPLRIVTSSQYTVDGATGNAERRGHGDLWAKLDALVRGRQVAWEWEPDETMYFQERAAELARLAMKRARL